MLSAEHENLCRAYGTIIRYCGEDSSRQGLVKTPARAARAMLYFTKGYEDSLDGKLQPTLIKVRKYCPQMQCFTLCKEVFHCSAASD